MTPDSTHYLIGVVAFDGVIPFHLSVPCLVFESVPKENPFEVVVCAVEAQPIRTTTGFGLTELASLDSLEQADVLVVPGWRDTLDHPPEILLEVLRRAYARGAQIIGLCYGAHVLASAGLLDGRRATTHWELASEIAERFPKVKFEPDVLYIEDGGVLTSAGTASSIDACLHVLRHLVGADVANHVARRLTLAPHRDGEQAQYIEQPLPTTSADIRLSRLFDSVRRRLNEPHDLDSLASEVAMSRRTFTRHFKALTGTTVRAWLLRERLALAQRLLESSDCNVEAVAHAVGFGSAEAFRQRFREAFGISPSSWRVSYRTANSPDITINHN